MEFICYSKCSTCKKAKDYLIRNNISFNEREIKENTPTIDEIKEWVDRYNIDINKLFNTSGLIYRDMNLKDRLFSMSYDEKLELLSNNAMLIKRPLLVLDNNVLVGFKEKEWNNTLL